MGTMSSTFRQDVYVVAFICVCSLEHETHRHVTGRKRVVKPKAGCIGLGHEERMYLTHSDTTFEPSGFLSNRFIWGW